MDLYNYHHNFLVKYRVGSLEIFPESVFSTTSVKYRVGSLEKQNQQAHV